MSEIRVNLLSDAAGTGPAGLFKQSAAKMFLNMNGTGSISIRQSLNVSSIVDDGVGSYTANLANAMSGATYSVINSAGDATNSGVMGGHHLQTTTTVKITAASRIDSFGLIDITHINSAIFGDLA